MGEISVNPYSSPLSGGPPWYRELTRYHWFVLVVAALGWIFDCLDQQLFTLARAPAMKELLKNPITGAVDPAQVDYWGPVTTAAFLIGWATGGIVFGILGDRIGRVKTMIITILLYSICTGLSALSYTVKDFALYRLMTGFGVGGEFAVGVALVAETMPDRARPYALGALQALSTIGNVSAALIGMAFGGLERSGALEGFHLFGHQITAWRGMFLVGTLPALLAVIIQRRLKEPERWKAAVGADSKHKAGSIRELFGDPRWRRRAVVGMVLASAGVIGLWGIGFFSPDLNRSVIRKYYEQQMRENGTAERDRDYLRVLASDPEMKVGDKSPEGQHLKPANLISPSADHNDAQAVFEAIQSLVKQNKPISPEAILARLDQPSSQPASPNRPRIAIARTAYLSNPPATGVWVTTLPRSSNATRTSTPS